MWSIYQLGNGGISDVSGTKIATGTIPATAANFTARNINGTTTFTQSATPTGAISGDLWIDTGNGNVIKTYNGTSWVTNPLSTGQLSGTIAASQVGFTIGGGNLLTNSSFENTTFSPSWGTLNATLSADTTIAYYGTTSAKVVTNASGTSGFYFSGVGRITLVPGQTYTYSAWFYSPIAISIQQSLEWYNSSSVRLSTTTAALQPIPANTWTRVSVTGTAPATASFTNATLYSLGRSAGDTWNVDAVQLEIGDVPTAYAPKVDEILPGTVASSMVNFTARTIGSTTTFTQSTTPTGALAGDLWIDTANGNTIKTYNGASWAVSQLGPTALNVVVGGGNLLTNSSMAAGIGNYIVNGSSALSTDAGNYYYAVGPGLRVTSTGAANTGAYRAITGLKPNTAYIYSSWVYIPATGGTASATTTVQGGVTSVANAMTTVTGTWTRLVTSFTTTATPATVNVFTYYSGPAAPAGQYFVTDAWQVEQGTLVTAYAPKPDEILPATVTGSMIANNTIGSGNVNFTARTIGSTTTFTQSTTPTGALTGDLWIDTANGNVLKTYNGSSWAVNQLSTAQLNGTIAASQVGFIVGGTNQFYNSSFENGMTGWFNVGGSTIAASALDAYVGTQSCLVTRSVGAGAGNVGVYCHPNVVPSRPSVLPGHTYTASVWVKPNGSATRLAQINIEFFNSTPGQTGTILTTTVSPTVTEVVGDWVRVTCTATAPATANYGNAVVRIGAQGTGCAEGESHFIDAFQWQEGSVATTYAPRTDEILPGTVTGSQIASNTIAASNVGFTIGGGNLLTNSNFATGLTGYVIQSAATIAVDPSLSWYTPSAGTAQSMKVTITGTASDTGAARAITSLVKPSTTYTATAYVYMATATAPANGIHLAVNGAGVIARTDGATTTVKDAWTRISVTFTTNSTTNGVTLYLVGTGNAAGTIVNTDAWQLELGDVATAYAQKPDEILAGAVSSSMVNFTARSIGGVTTFTQSATPTGAVAGDLWIDTANGNTIKQYSGSAWTTYQFGVNALGANSVTYQQLAVPDFNNLAAGSDFEIASLVPWTLSAFTLSTTQAHNGTQSLKISGGAGGSATLQTKIQAKPGDTFYVEFWAYADSSWNGTGGNSKLRFGNQTGVFITALDYAATSVTPNTWVKRTQMFVVPAGTTALGVTLSNDGTAGNIWLDDIVIQRQLSGANQIAAGSIVGGNIASGTISSSNVNFTARSIGGITTFTQSTTPVGAIANDLWIDTGNGNLLKQYTGSSWTAVQDTAIAAAAGAASTAQTAANTAQTAANAAQTTANGKATIYRQATQPAGVTAGDTWFDTANGNRVSIYDGSAWNLSQLQGVAVGNLDAGAITTGSLSSARIAANTISASQLVSGTITAASGVIGSIDAATITVGQITGAQIAANTVTAGNIATGTITAASGVIGSIDAATITVGKITGTQIAGTTITAANIVGNTITSAQIATGTITAASGVIGSIDAATITVGKITGTQIAGTTITAANIAGGTITATQMATGTITAASGVIGSIDAAKITVGLIAGTQIASQTITAGNIATGTITAASGIIGSIDASTITVGKITGTQIAGTTITGSNIAGGTITAAQMQTGTISAASGIISSIDAATITVGQINSGQIAAGAITTAQLGANAVTAAKLNVTMGGSNLLNNTNSGITTGWTGDNGGNAVLDATKYWYSPVGSLRINVNTFSGSGAGQSGLTLQPNTTYTASAYVNIPTSNGPTGGMHIVVSGAGVAGTLLGPTVTTTGSWVRTSMTFTTNATATPVNVRFDSVTSANGQFFNLDAAQLEIGDVATAYSPKTDEILPGTVVANMISAGAVTTAAMTAGTINGDRISSNTLDASAIIAGSITAGMISTGTLGADVIIGARLKTSDTGTRVELSQDGLSAYYNDGTNPDVSTFSLSATDGSLRLAGTLTAGTISSVTMGDSTILNSAISGSDLLIDDTGGQVFVYAPTGQTVLPPFTTSGTWTAPTSITYPTGSQYKIKVECWGAGGAGGNAGTGTYASFGALGGAGGEYSREDFVTVTAGTTYSYSVGAGGLSSATWPANKGGDSYFVGDSATVLAKGGGGSFGGYQVNGGSGSNNQIHFAGGGNAVSVSGTTAYGCGGGSSAGTSRSGSPGRGSTSTAAGAGGAAPTGGGSGGSGGAAGANGVSGLAPGGAGGGAGGGGGAKTGGNGAHGQIRVTYGGTVALVASISGVAGTDTYGNSFSSGVTITKAGGGYDKDYTYISATGGAAPALLSGWSIFGSGYQVPRLYKDAMGFVHLEGLVAGGTSTIFNLPSGYRPGASQMFAQICNNGVARITVNSGGTVQLTSTTYGSASGTAAFVSLAGMTWFAEA